jgi:hypothetical protein
MRFILHLISSANRCVAICGHQRVMLRTQCHEASEQAPSSRPSSAAPTMHAMYRTNQQFHFRRSRCVSRLFHVRSRLTRLECVYCRTGDLSANHPTSLSLASSKLRVIETSAPSFDTLHSTCTSIRVGSSYTILRWNFSLASKVKNHHHFLVYLLIQCKEWSKPCSAL